jgi:hypothetical protein
MPCNALIQQAAQLGISPALILGHPPIIRLLADRIQTTLANAAGRPVKLAVCGAGQYQWAATYNSHLAQVENINTLNPNDGICFFSEQCSIAVYPDGSVQLRDGMRVGYKPPYAETLLTNVTDLIRLVAGLVLQQTIMAQVGTVATIINSETAANGALVLTINSPAT